jgi:phosphoribosylformimino-5-aminoimidazole carboxamide ribotide isomerase
MPVGFQSSMLVIPAIDLRDGRCVRLTQGRKVNATVYDGDPIEIALSYESSGAQMVHLVDLDGAFSDPNSRNRQVLGEICSRIRIPLQFGGGLRSLQDVAQVIELGVARVVIGTLAVEEPQLLTQLLRLFGADRIAVGIDARNGQVLTRGWEKEEKVSALELAREVAHLGVERIVYTDVARDGMLTGVNVEQTSTIARESGLKVTASGGISSLADIQRLLTPTESVNSSLKEFGAGCIDSVIIGKALYEGRFTLQQALLKISEHSGKASK